jgi:DNA-binding transcriptional LysR family regulator
MSANLTSRRLPSLNALRAFEAVGRRGRITAAADELHVSHGAVSRQVKLLEQALGIALLEGPKNRLRPTPAAQALLAALTPAFDMIEEAVAATGMAAEQLPICCHATPSSKWLIPRLPRFHAAHPGLRVELSELPSTDFTMRGVKAAVRMVAGPAPGPFDTTGFMPNHVGPVVSPAFGHLTGDVAGLFALPLIGSTSWPQGWRDWAELAGVGLDRARPIRRFARQQYMLEAAIAGLGAAIAPWPLVAGDIAAGRLTAPFGFVRAPGTFAVITPRGRRDPATRAFVDWLVAEGRAMPQPPAPAEASGKSEHDAA